MAAGDPKYVMVAGAASATLATAVSNLNTAIETIMTNANDAIWLATGPIPQVLESGLIISPADVIGNNTYTGYAMMAYNSAS